MAGALEMIDVKSIKDLKRQTEIMDKDPNIMLVCIYSSAGLKMNEYRNTLTGDGKTVRYKKKA
jgi:hypothetical protein